MIYGSEMKKVIASYVGILGLIITGVSLLVHFLVPYQVPYFIPLGLGGMCLVVLALLLERK